MVSMRKVKLPQLLKSFFWDHHFGKLTWQADRELIIRRVLEDGSWDAVRWLRKKMGEDALRSWILDHEGRGLSSRQIRFWELTLNLPRRRTNQWVRRAQENPWAGR